MGKSKIIRESLSAPNVGKTRTPWFPGNQRETGRGGRRPKQANVFISKKRRRGFSDGPVVMNSPANAGDPGLIPGLERSHLPRGN